MWKSINKSLREFFEELRFGPRPQRVSQVMAAEDLLSIVDTGKSYPLDFICFKITDYRPKTELKTELIGGGELIEALREFIVRVSRQISLTDSDEGQEVFSMARLAEEYSVSLKTVQRWRKKGLVAKTYLFEDNSKRMGFAQGSVESFLQRNSGLIERAKNFTKISDKEKDAIFKLTRKLASKCKYNRHVIISKVAEQTGRSNEAIRLLLVDHDSRDPEKSVFRKPSHVITSREAANIYKLHGQGISVKELMKRFDRSRSSIYRILNKRRAKALLVQKIEYVDSDEFLGENAEENILLRSSGSAAAPNSIKSPLLTRQQEMELFREYNYLKYLACLTRAKIDRIRPSSMRLLNIERLLGRAEDIKKTIIEANLGLVVSIARKHLVTGSNMHELISEGNFSLMRTVEKFDYTRGYRFNTYASWAITKYFAKKMPTEAKRRDRSNADELSTIEHDLRVAGVVDIASVERAHHSLDEVIKNNLDEREQFIIRNHFGLDGTIAKKKFLTLQQIGDTLSITRERVRQIELEALQKLRHNLSPEEFDLLTK